MITNSLTTPWALAIVTNPARAAAVGIMRRRAAWHALMAARGKRCHFPGPLCGATMAQPGHITDPGAAS
ncbi:hypothetical protein [Paenirhodobacter sp. CAU 1674]|uniref:hypothetical protein n=1 Tax=Paenirhodobacter sp. CAU 1674 TaxID=3032596 RepID=UPI0023D9FBFD|nr:hypothetical protein [Paenirhodobacter sp. CAU 1674]MDF2140832.1 hypothetical protein [Paenirhodobacter sp. CAU 1674]